MKLIKRISSWLMALCIIGMLLPAVPAAAQESTAIQPVPETPSAWAEGDVALAYLHELAPFWLFWNYQESATYADLLNVSIALYEKLSAETVDYTSLAALLAEVDVEAEVTREEAAVVLFQVIQRSFPQLDFQIEAEMEFSDISDLDSQVEQAALYLAANDVIRGKADGQLNLADPLSREQLLVMASRTFEFVLQETNTASKGLVWKVSGGLSTVYVLGSIHVADISLYPLDNIIVEAFEESTYLAVEANVIEDVYGNQYIDQVGVYSDGSTLDQHVSEETYQLFAEVMETYGIPADIYNILKPWYASSVLEVVMLFETPYSVQFGIDNTFINSAIALGKPIIELESMQFQADMLNSFDADVQEQLLRSYLIIDAEGMEEVDPFQVQVELLETMLELWKAGDAELFEQLILAQMALEAENVEEYTNVVWIDRNRTMSETVLDYLADPAGETYFVVVGAGHLFGEYGIIEEMEKAGYEVEQLLD